MRNEIDLLRVMNKTAMNTVNTTKPTDLVYGEVISTSPLEVLVDQKLTLPRENLILTRMVLDYEVDMTFDHLTENRSGGSGEGSFDSHNHQVLGRKKVTIHNGLVIGDKVLMLRVQNGNQYLIIDKEVS